MVAGKRFTGGVMIAFVCAFAMLAVAALASAETPPIDQGKDTGVQTCALPISRRTREAALEVECRLRR